MYKFILNSLFFIVIGYIAFAAVDAIFSKVASRSGAEGIWQWGEWMEGGVEADCVILGNSRANQHVSPHVVDSILGTNSFNLGVAGAHFDLMKAVYQLFKERNGIPEFVMINVDYSSLIPTRPELNRLQYCPWFGDIRFRELVFPIMRPTIAERLLPMYRYHDSGIRLFVPQRSRLKGFKPQDMTFDRSVADKNTLLFKRQKEIELSFNDLLDMIEVDGAKVLLFFSPYQEDTFNRMPNSGEMFSYYDSLGVARDIPVLDFSRMWICSDTTFFTDGLHLNRRGAMIFSDSLAQKASRVGISGKKL